MDNSKSNSDNNSDNNSNSNEEILASLRGCGIDIQDQDLRFDEDPIFIDGLEFRELGTARSPWSASAAHGLCEIPYDVGDSSDPDWYEDVYVLFWCELPIPIEQWERCKVKLLAKHWE